jgi:hypothetical protein
MPINWDEPVRTGAAVGGGAAAAMGASLNAKAVDSMASDAKEMLRSAKSGGFRVSEDAAKPIRDLLDEMKGRVESLVNDLGVIAGTEPTLGNHDYGKRVAAHQRDAFEGAEGSAIPVLRAFYDVLESSCEALDVAAKRYAESESSASDVFKGQV